MCGKVILEIGGMLKSVSDWQKNQEMWNKSVDTYPSATQFVPKYYKTHKNNIRIMIKLLILVLLHLIRFWINIRLKKCVIKMFPKNLLC